MQKLIKLFSFCIIFTSKDVTGDPSPSLIHRPHPPLTEVGEYSWGYLRSKPPYIKKMEEDYKAKIKADYAKMPKEFPNSDDEFMFLTSMERWGRSTIRFASTKIESGKLVATQKKEKGAEAFPTAMEDFIEFDKKSLIDNFVNPLDVKEKIKEIVQGAEQKEYSKQEFMKALIYNLLHVTEALCNVVVFQHSKNVADKLKGYVHFSLAEYRASYYGIILAESGSFKNKDGTWAAAGAFNMSDNNTATFTHRPCYSVSMEQLQEIADDISQTGGNPGGNQIVVDPEIGPGTVVVPPPGGGNSGSADSGGSGGDSGGSGGDSGGGGGDSGGSGGDGDGGDGEGSIPYEREALEAYAQEQLDKIGEGIEKFPENEEDVAYLHLPMEEKMEKNMITYPELMPPTSGRQSGGGGLETFTSVTSSIGQVAGAASGTISTATGILDGLVNVAKLGKLILEAIDRFIEKHKRREAFLKAVLIELQFLTENLCNIVVGNLNKPHDASGIKGIVYYKSYDFQGAVFGSWIFHHGVYINKDIIKADKWGLVGDFTVRGGTATFNNRPCYHRPQKQDATGKYVINIGSLLGG